MRLVNSMSRILPRAGRPTSSSIFRAIICKSLGLPCAPQLRARVITPPLNHAMQPTHWPISYDIYNLYLSCGCGCCRLIRWIAVEIVGISHMLDVMPHIDHILIFYLVSIIGVLGLWFFKRSWLEKEPAKSVVGKASIL